MGVRRPAHSGNCRACERFGARVVLNSNGLQLRYTGTVLVRFVCVLRVSVCPRVRLCVPCGSPGVFFTGTVRRCDRRYTHRNVRNMAAPATNAIERLRESSKIERLRYLWSSAQQHPGMPDLQRILLLGLDRLAAHDEAPLPNRARQRSCGKCFVPLVPGFNSHVTQSRHPRRPPARRCVFRVHCESCGHANAFPKAAPPSSRSSSKPPATAPSPKSTKSRKPASPILPSKKRRVQPTPAPAPAPAGDGFFGFDFVPLLGS